MRSRFYYYPSVPRGIFFFYELPYSTIFIYGIMRGFFFVKKCPKRFIIYLFGFAKNLILVSFAYMNNYCFYISSFPAASVIRHFFEDYFHIRICDLSDLGLKGIIPRFWGLTGLKTHYNASNYS